VRGGVARARGRAGRGRAGAAAAWAAQPRQVDALVVRARAIGMIGGRVDESLAEFERALATGAPEHVVRNARGLVLEANGRFGKALEDVDHILLQRPTAVRARRDRARILGATGQPTDAIAHCTA